MSQSESLTVAVTGPTGTFGFGLMPLLEVEPRIGRVIGIARRPFDPAAHGWSKLTYRQGDVRDPEALRAAFAGADVVVHLAFMITGNASRETIRAINVQGTLNTFAAAAEAGVNRFVYASSVAAYGFHADNPVPITEDWPTRPADRLFYAIEKAELEHELAEAQQRHPETELYLLRPPVVLGPHAGGAKQTVPGPVAALGRGALRGLAKVPVPVPVPAPDALMQFIHEADVGSALMACVLAAGPPGAYNIAATDTLSVGDVIRTLGLRPVRLPAAILHRPARLAAALTRIPGLPPTAEWVEALAHPSVMDTSKARRELGWEPRYSARDALLETLG